MSLSPDHLMLMHNLTPLQADYLRFIVEYARDHNGNSPGQREIARHFDVHWNTARGHLFELSNKRLLRIENGHIVVEDSVWTPPPHVE
jgi:Mn-dependent DtxR family transcriptional regulator